VKPLRSRSGPQDRWVVWISAAHHNSDRKIRAGGMDAIRSDLNPSQAASAVIRFKLMER
jgi:hypothetical protein